MTENKTIIELNGPGERIEFSLLTLMMPLWSVIFPLTGLLALPNISGFVLIAASLFCMLHFVYCYNYHFTFEELGIRLPGIDQRLLPYANITRIYLYGQRFMGVEIVPISLFKRGKSEERKEVRICNIGQLTEEASHQLQALLQDKLSNCDISAQLIEKLVNCKRKTVNLNWWLKLPDDSILSKTWFVLWGTIVIIAYPTGFAWRLDQNGAIQLIAAIAQHCQRPIKEWLMWRISITPEQMLAQQNQYLHFLFGTDQGRLFFFGWLCFMVVLFTLTYKWVLKRIRIEGL